jgi:hypothetical protein
VADSFCNECDPETLDFRRFDKATNVTTVYMCRSTCNIFFRACSVEAASAGITTAADWCAQWPTVLKLHDPTQTKPPPPKYVMSKYDRRCYYGIGYQTGFFNIEQEIGRCLPDPGNSTAPFSVPPPKATPTPVPKTPSLVNGKPPFHPFKTIGDFIETYTLINPSMGVLDAEAAARQAKGSASGIALSSCVVLSSVLVVVVALMPWTMQRS